ncbi:hypothetical protein SDC9_114843 [bioreactor metagenome]|uniref:Uncharacterized protein n=1 Tax=bioreactor metagenome TaxID=1076179 RepID=A0A645BS55_9ZZZZ
MRLLFRDEVFRLFKFDRVVKAVVEACNAAIHRVNVDRELVGGVEIALLLLRVDEAQGVTAVESRFCKIGCKES